MQEYDSSSTLQDYGSVLPQKDLAMDGASRLLRLAELAQELGAEPVAEEARELAKRVSEGRFYVACIGQFKRGKSTLLNALVGYAVVPTGFIPVTAVPTVIRFGDQLQARVRMKDGSWRVIAMSDLKEYVTEELNPENRKAVEGAEVFVPSALLSSGMCFVDTPGLGSVFTGNTATTQAFIPHIDAALVVVGADPPIAGEELALVEAVGKQVQDLILVINKADRTSDAERAAAAKFTREILEKRLQRSIGEVFEISAVERIENRGPLRDWEKLLAGFHHLVEDSGRNLVRAACDRGLQRLSEQLLAIASEDRDALQRPIGESERRIALMKETIGEAERSMRELGFLFMAEQQRISDFFVDRRHRFVGSALAESQQEFDEELRSVHVGFGPSYRRRLMHFAQEVSRRRVTPWLKVEQEEGELQYRAVAARFVELGNSFLKKLTDAGLTELARMPHALDAEKGLRVRSRFTFEDFLGTADPPSPLRWLADVFLPLVGGRKLITNEARAFLEHLLETNTSRVQNDVLNRIQESRDRLEVEIRKLLHEISRVAEQALDRARKVREEGAPAVRSAIERLARIERDILALLSFR
ncbi:dynamin family protein [Acidicapsa dinghuensis]|uniref:Dynamin family protein n=1 Tax=Acidicapsa dinghuensis TaxID=2218256 RepID=A0ABW1EE12_9BACT|nr:dynamin family protein [Acidicapsa dinghuensis]